MCLCHTNATRRCPHTATQRVVCFYRVYTKKGVILAGYALRTTASIDTERERERNQRRRRHEVEKQKISKTDALALRRR